MAKKKITESEARAMAEAAIDAVQDLNHLADQIQKGHVEPFSDEAFKIASTLSAVARNAADASVSVLMHLGMCRTVRQMEALKAQAKAMEAPEQAQ